MDTAAIHRYYYNYHLFFVFQRYLMIVHELLLNYKGHITKLIDQGPHAYWLGKI